MGAHVWGPAYLRDHLLPNGRITGWAPDWYAGFPASTSTSRCRPADRRPRRAPALRHRLQARHRPRPGHPPARRLRLRAPGRHALPGPGAAGGGHGAVPLRPALHDLRRQHRRRRWPGEFAFSISLSFALVFLGVVARGLDTGSTAPWRRCCSPSPGCATSSRRSSRSPARSCCSCCGPARPGAKFLARILVVGRPARRLLVVPVPDAPALHEQHGLGEAHRVQQEPVPRRA